MSISPDRPSVSARGLAKVYRLGTIGSTSLRDEVTRAWQRLSDRESTIRQPRGTFTALNDVSFDLAPGEVVGIIGRNGAGKSTLLKILSRITMPTRGTVTLRGRVASLLEVGTGFHPELTGRENVFLSGAILGMTRSEIRRKFDEIAAFSEIESFLDTPVKRYSSGMYVRLAFAVAAHLDAEVLLLDEVLAVGDAGFQKKCLRKVESLADGGRTVLLVSHNLAAVQKMCGRSLLLVDGRIALDGQSTDVIRRYLQPRDGPQGRLNVAGRHRAAEEVSILDAWLEKDGHSVSSLLFGESARVVITIDVKRRTAFSVELMLRQADGLPVAFAPSGLAFDWVLDAEPGVVTVAAELPPLRLAVGAYSIDLNLANAGVGFFDAIESALAFTVDAAAIGPQHWSFSQRRGQGHELWDVRFEVISRESLERRPSATGV